jgi:hypothetical protein
LPFGFLEETLHSTSSKPTNAEKLAKFKNLPPLVCSGVPTNNPTIQSRKNEV